jgi:hypothetical protein
MVKTSSLQGGVMKAVLNNLIVIGIFFVCSGNTQGAVVIDTFDEGGGFHPQFNIVAADVIQEVSYSSALRMAVQFPVAGDDFIFNSVTLPISVQKNVPDHILRIRLTEDDGGVPGETIEVLSLNEDIWPDFSNPFTNRTTLSSSVNPVLSMGRSYWIVVEPTAMPSGEWVFVDYRWFYNTNGAELPVRQQQQQGDLPVDPWSGYAGAADIALRVDGMHMTPPPDLSMRFSEVELCWVSESNFLYQVQYQSDLTSNLWENLGLPVEGDGNRKCVRDAIPEEGQPQRFYRLIYP